MKTRSSGEDPISPVSEPQRKKQLRAKAAKINPNIDTFNIDPHIPVEMENIEDMNPEQLAALRLELVAERERQRLLAENRDRRPGFYEDEGVEENNRLRERTNYSPIILPAAVNWALKSNIIANFPKFHGGPSENPHNHLKSLTNQIQNIKPPDLNIDLEKLKAFPCTMENSAKVWFDSLIPGSITTWQQMAEAFLKKYWTQTKVENFEKDIVAVNQTRRMSYCEYYRNWIATQELWPLTSLSRK